MPMNFRKFLSAATMMSGVLISSYANFASADCSRGSLDSNYCDVDNDLVADSPVDESKWKNPSTLVFTYTPVEDPAVYKDAFADFQAYLSKATGKKVIYYTVQSNSAEIEAMRSGRLHIAGFSTGPTGFAVNLAGAVPIAVKGGPDGFQGYNLVVITRKNSGIKSLADLKGKKVAHTSPSSNSGNLAPRALLPDQGIVPDQDYEVSFSGKHDQSILGVVSGDYDAAPVASDVLERMIGRGVVNADDIEILYRSPKFPTSSFAYAHDLHPDLVHKIVGAFHTYRFPPEMQKAFKGADRFYPITYKADWGVIRTIAAATGTSYDRKGLTAMAEKEAAKKKK